jgi:hypothetical protein
MGAFSSWRHWQSCRVCSSDSMFFLYLLTEISLACASSYPQRYSLLKHLLRVFISALGCSIEYFMVDIFLGLVIILFQSQLFYSNFFLNKQAVLIGMDNLILTIISFWLKILSFSQIKFIIQIGWFQITVFLNFSA